MVSDLVPILWLYRPPGIDKSTVGWEIFTQLTQAAASPGPAPAPAAPGDRWAVLRSLLESA